MYATAALYDPSLLSLSRYPKLKLAKIELDEPQEHEVLVKISSCGICGTDHEVLNGDLPTGKPCVLGHEGAGIIEAIGSKVSQFKVGDRVLISFPSCGKCRNCLREVNAAIACVTSRVIVNWPGRCRLVSSGWMARMPLSSPMVTSCTAISFSSRAGQPMPLPLSAT